MSATRLACSPWTVKAIGMLLMTSVSSGATRPAIMRLRANDHCSGGVRSRRFWWVSRDSACRVIRAFPWKDIRKMAGKGACRPGWLALVRRERDRAQCAALLLPGAHVEQPGMFADGIAVGHARDIVCNGACLRVGCRLRVETLVLGREQTRLAQESRKELAHDTRRFVGHAHHLVVPVQIVVKKGLELI